MSSFVRLTRVSNITKDHVYHGFSAAQPVSISFRLSRACCFLANEESQPTFNYPQGWTRHQSSRLFGRRRPPLCKSSASVAERSSHIPFHAPFPLSVASARSALPASISCPGPKVPRTMLSRVSNRLFALHLRHDPWSW